MVTDAASAPHNTGRSGKRPIDLENQKRGSNYCRASVKRADVLNVAFMAF
jgi:hypothetical protein